MQTDCWRLDSIWDIFQKLWLQISSPFLWNTCFSCHLIWRVAEFSFIFSGRCIFYKIMFIHEIKLVFPKIWKKVFDFNLLFIWMKNFLVEDCYLHGKHLLTDKVNIFKIKKCYPSLPSESLKNIHERISFRLKSKPVVCRCSVKRCPKTFSQCLQEIA